MATKKNIAVLMGGPSAEHEVSLQTGKVILASLNPKIYNAVPVVITKDIKWKIQFDNQILELNTPKAIEYLKTIGKIDVVFIAMHGTYGEDGTIQKLLDYAHLPYTGSSALTSTLAMDKVKSSEIFTHNGLTVPSYLAITEGQWKISPDKILSKIKRKMTFPFVVKPSGCGSSVGITIVKNTKNLNKAILLAFSFCSTVLTQEYIQGTEVTCAVLDEGGNKKPLALPPTEIIPLDANFFDYHAKYTPGASREITPPELPKQIVKNIQQIAVKAHTLLGCSGMSRTDMILSKDNIFVLETNTIPGMTPTSLYPQAAAAVGITFPQLLDKIILSALNKK